MKGDKVQSTKYKVQRRRRYMMLVVLLLVLGSCRNRTIPGPYYIDPDNCLNFDLGNGGLGRSETMSYIAWTDRYIFSKGLGEYYWFDKTKDKGLYHNYEDIVNGPLDFKEYKHVLDSLGIVEFNYAIDL